MAGPVLKLSVVLRNFYAQSIAGFKGYGYPKVQ